MRKYEKEYIAGTLDIEKIQRSLAGWLGHAKFADTYNLRIFLLDKWQEIIEKAAGKDKLAGVGAN